MPAGHLFSFSYRRGAEESQKAGAATPVRGTQRSGAQHVHITAGKGEEPHLWGAESEASLITTFTQQKPLTQITRLDQPGGQ